MNNEKVADYFDIIAAIYYVVADNAKTEQAKLNRKKNGVLYKKAATTIRKQTDRVMNMTVEELTALPNIGLALAETIQTLRLDAEDRKPLLNVLNDYVKLHPVAEDLITARLEAVTGREKFNNMQKILFISQGKVPFNAVTWVYHLFCTAEALNFLGMQDKLPFIYNLIEKIVTMAKSDLLPGTAFTEEERGTIGYPYLGEANIAGSMLMNYLTVEKGVSTRVIQFAVDLYLAYDDSEREDMELLVNPHREYTSVEEALQILQVVDSELYEGLQMSTAKTAEEYFALYEEMLANPEFPVEEEEDVVVEEEDVVPKPPTPAKKPVAAPKPSEDARSYRERIVEVLESMAAGYAVMNRIQISNLYADAAKRIKDRVDKKFNFNSVNELKQIVYRKTLLVPSEITAFLERYESGKLSNDEKKALLAGEKRYSERKEKEVVGNTPITKSEIISFLQSLATKESTSGSAEVANLYRDTAERLTKAKASVSSAKEGYEQIWYGKPLLPLEVAFLVEEYAAKQKTGGTSTTKKTATFDFRSLLKEKAHALFEKEDVTLQTLVGNTKDLTEDDRVVLYWGPALGPSNKEQLKMILIACGLKGSVGATVGGIAYWKPYITFEEALEGPLNLFFRGRFDANDKRYFILQIAGTEPPFLVELR